MGALEQKVLVRRRVRGNDDPRTDASRVLEEALRYVGMVVQHGERTERDPAPCIDGWFTQGLFVDPGVCEFSVRFRMSVADSMDGGRSAVVEAFVSEPVVVDAS